MSSIGPQLPPHLTKRRRSPEDEAPDSPPGKRGKSGNSNNRNEIALDASDDSDDDYGPRAPGPAASSRPSIGPTLPPSNTYEIDLQGPDSDSDSDSNTGPRLPSSKPQPASTANPPPRRVLGPAPPPADLSTRPPDPPSPRASASDSSSEDEYGPAVAASATSSRRRAELAAHAGPATDESLASAAPKRDDWMLAPPTDQGYRAPDPTKLRNRKFASGKSASSGAGGGGGIASIWTETPEQKRKRLEDAVLGRGGDGGGTPAGGPGGGRSSASRETARDQLERERKIGAYTAQTRGPSLYEERQHAASKKKKGGDEAGDEEEEDDPSKRAFDRDKDMALGGKIGTAQRRELLNRAADFGGRFQKGSYL